MQLVGQGLWLLHHKVVSLLGLRVKVLRLKSRLAHNHLLHVSLVEFAVLRARF